MTVPKLEFPPFRLPPQSEALRAEVREFLAQTLPNIKTEDRFATWTTRSVPSGSFSLRSSPLTAQLA